MSIAVVVWLALVVVAAAVFIVAAYARRWEWAGFTGPPSTGQGSKTLWDWLQLLVIPLGLAAVAFALNLAQSGREQRREDGRAAPERSIALGRQREDALVLYVQQMSDLMLERGLLTSREGSEVRAIARTLTVSVLRRLDSQRQGFVLQFLSAARLIDRIRPKVSMRGVDLRGATVRGSLGPANFREADLRKADFRGSDLNRVSFLKSKLHGADFSTAHGENLWFNSALLSRANFTQVRFSNVNFSSAHLTPADFGQAELWFSDFLSACLIDARFARATLREASFMAATGRDVDFAGAGLQGVNFQGANFVRINLTGVRRLGNNVWPDPGRSKVSEC